MSPFILATILARLESSTKALLVLCTALLVVGAVFAWMWLQERKSSRVYRKHDTQQNLPPASPEPQRTPGLSLAEEKRRQGAKDRADEDGQRS